MVWYVPDVNRLVEAGTSEHSQESFASMLAPAVERGELTIVGESTPEAFRRGLDDRWVGDPKHDPENAKQYHNTIRKLRTRAPSDARRPPRTAA